MQADDDGMLHAVRYGSYSTTPAQADYSAEDLESLGLMYALKSIEWLAQCRHVTVITDNTAVLHIQDWIPRNRRQRRMLTYIMQFNLTICYICRSSNTKPDSLSRLFQDSSPQERQENEAKYMHEVDDFILPVMTRFQQKRASPGQTDIASDKPSVQRQPEPASLQREQTLHSRVRDDTTLPAAAQLTGGNRKTPTKNSEMNSSCDVQQTPVPPPGSTPVQAATRDESTLPEVAQLQRGDTKTPLRTT